MKPPLLKIQNLSFSYSLEQQTFPILKDLHFKVETGDFIGIQGPSGSGKSTLFYILGLLLKPSAGHIYWNEMDLTSLSSDHTTFFRNQKIGFIFQQFHLLSKATVLENILLPTHYPSEFIKDNKRSSQKAIILAKRLGLEDHLTHFPNQLSGGQQQRVAIARALIQDVDLILADEPTGNLDHQNASKILDLFHELNHQGKTLVLITHDTEVAKQCSKVYHLNKGRFTEIKENLKIKKKLPFSVQTEVQEGVLPSLDEKKNLDLNLKKIFFEKNNSSTLQKIIFSTFPLARENLARNLIQSLFTMLGVLVGIAAVLSMVTLGNFTQRKILETYETLGVNKLLVGGYPSWKIKATDVFPTYFRSFDWEKDILPLKRLFSEIRFLSPVLISFQDQAAANGKITGHKITLLGILPEYLNITHRRLQQGKNINPMHVEYRSAVCLLGFEIAQHLFPYSSAIGQRITFSEEGNQPFPCQVIGVLSSTTSNEEWNPPNLQIMVPFTYFQSIQEQNDIYQVALQIKNSSELEIAGKKIQAYFTQKYGKSGQFYVNSDSTLVAQMKRFLTLFSVLLTAIALLSLVVGGVGIHNMMIVSVTERIREFGLRKALGATHRSIRTQILIESLILCLTAGSAGLIVGFCSYQLLILCATKLIPNLHYEWVIEPFALFLSLISMITVGIMSGLLPARKAEKLEAINALRFE